MSFVYNTISLLVRNFHHWIVLENFSIQQKKFQQLRFHKLFNKIIIHKSDWAKGLSKTLEIHEKSAFFYRYFLFQFTNCSH